MAKPIAKRGAVLVFDKVIILRFVIGFLCSGTGKEVRTEGVGEELASGGIGLPRGLSVGVNPAPIGWE